MKRENAIIAGIRQRPVAVAEFRRARLAGSRPFWPNPTGTGDGGRMSPDSGACSIPVAGCCRIPVLPGFRRLTTARFRQSDIKCACKDEEFNFEKQFTVLKTVNSFPKIKKCFTVKPKMIFIDHYFRPSQTL
jgi:hypothetical protein